MARTTGPLIAVLLLQLAAPFSGSGAKGQGRADYLLPRLVAPLIVYDATQQPVDDPERVGIVPGAPLRILNADDLMSDRITPCIRVSLGARVFFLVKNAGPGGGEPGSDSRAQVIRDVVALQDTMEIVVPSAVKFTASGRHIPELAAHARVERVFLESERIYGRILPGNAYGWFDLTPGTEAFGPAPKQPLASNEAVTDDIRRHLRETNQVLREAYERMEQVTGTRHPVPRWELVLRGGEIVCLLQNVKDPGVHEASARLLARVIEQTVKGAGRSVSVRPGRITIQ